MTTLAGALHWRANKKQHFFQRFHLRLHFIFCTFELDFIVGIFSFSSDFFFL